MTPTSVFIDGKEYIPKPESIDRQAILRGEYMPQLNTEHWSVEGDGKIRGPFTDASGCPWRTNEAYREQCLACVKNGTRFFPTEADAVEYVSIQKSIETGECLWLPKKDDHFICVGILPEGHAQYTWTATYDYNIRLEKSIYVVSDEQAERFLAKHKPKAKDGLESEHFDDALPRPTVEGWGKLDKHNSALKELALICIQHGGRFGMPDKEWFGFESVYFDRDDKEFDYDRFDTFCYPTLHFPIGKAKDFLATPGVTEKLESFFFIVSGK